MEEHPIYGFARHYNPKLTDAQIKAQFIDNGKYSETLERLREEAYPDLDSDTFLSKFHSQYADLSKKKENGESVPSISGSASYSWDSGTPKLAKLQPITSQTAPGSSGKADLDLSKRASQEITLQKARNRPNYDKAATPDDYTEQQIEGKEKEYRTRLSVIQTDSDNLQRAIEASDARIKEKWGDNWMKDYYARQEALKTSQDPELSKKQEEFEADQYINDRNNFISALEANYAESQKILKDDKYEYARALEEYDKKKAAKAENAGWGNLTLGILQRTVGKAVGSIGQVMNIAENVVREDKKYNTWDKVEDFFIDYQDQVEKVAPRPTKYTRPLYTSTAKTKLNGEKVEVDFQDGKPSVIRDSKGSVIRAVNEGEFADLAPKNQWNGKGLIYQTGEVLADAAVQIATTKGIGGTLVKTGMGAKTAYQIGVTASTMGQMAGGLYEQGLKMFDGDKRKAAQYAAMTGISIGAASNLFGLEARLAGGPGGLLDNMTVAQAAKGLTPKMAAAQTAKNWLKAGLGEAAEETVGEEFIKAGAAMAMNGDPEDIDLNEMKGTAVISFATGLLMSAGSNDFKNTAWVVAAENPDLFKVELQKLKDSGQNVDVEKMHQKALKIKGLADIKQNVTPEDVDKLDEIVEINEKADKVKALGLAEQAKAIKEEAVKKGDELLKEEVVEDTEIETQEPQVIKPSDDLLGKQFTYNGYTGELKKEGARYVLENDRQIIELNEDTEIDVAKEDEITDNSGKLSDRYKVSFSDNKTAIINDVEYDTISDDNGSIVGLSPKSKPDQVIKNERMLVAAEIERNKLESVKYRKTTDEEYVSIRDQHDDGVEIETVLSSGMTESISNAIDLLYDEKELDDDSALELAYWIDDRIAALEKMDTSSSQKAINNLNTIKDRIYESSSQDARANVPKKRVKKATANKSAVAKQAEVETTKQVLLNQSTPSAIEQYGETKGLEATQEVSGFDAERRGLDKSSDKDIKQMESTIAEQPTQSIETQQADQITLNEAPNAEQTILGELKNKEARYTGSEEGDSGSDSTIKQLPDQKTKAVKEDVQAEVEKTNDDVVITKNGVFAFSPKARIIRAFKKLWAYTFFPDGNLPDLASALNQKRVHKISAEMKKADLISDRLRKEIKGFSPEKINDLNDALQSPQLGKQQMFYSDGTAIEPAIENALVEMRNHVDSLSSQLIFSGVTSGDMKLTILDNLQTFMTGKAGFNQDWESMIKFANRKIKRIDGEIGETEGSEQVALKTNKLRMKGKKMQFLTGLLERYVRANNFIKPTNNPNENRIGSKDRDGDMSARDINPDEIARRRTRIGNAYSTGNYTYEDGSAMEPWVIETLDAMRELSTEIEADIKELNLLQNEGTNLELPKYLTRSYQVHWDRDWFDKVQDTAVFTRAVDFFRKERDAEEISIKEQIKHHQKELSKAILGSDPHKMIMRKIEKLEEELEDLEMFDPVAETMSVLYEQSSKLTLDNISRKGTLGSIPMGVLKKRKDIPKEVRDLWGEMKEPIHNYTNSIFKIAHILENNKFLRETVRQGEGKFLFTKPQGEFYAQLPESQTMGDLGGYYTTPEIAEAFKEYNRPIGQSDNTDPFSLAYSMVMKLSSMAKSFMTVFSVGSANRNLMANPFLMIQRGLWNPVSKNTSEAIRYFRKGTDAESYRLFELGVLGDGNTFGELQDIRKQYAKTPVPGPANKAVEAYRAARDFMEAYYQFGDDFFRLIHFNNGKNKLAKIYKGKKFEELEDNEKQEIEEMAAERVSEEMPTYSRLPRGIKALRRNPLVSPFPSFPYEMFRTTKNVTLNLINDMKNDSGYKENGVSYAAQVLAKNVIGSAAIFVGTKALASTLMHLFAGLGPDDDEKLKYFLPSYHEDSLIIPNRNDNGVVTYFDTGVILPQGHMINVMSNLYDKRFSFDERMVNAAGKFLEPFYSMDPLVKAMGEAMVGYKFDTKKPISDKGETNWLRDRIFHVAPKLVPGTFMSADKIRRSFTEPETDFFGKLYPANEIMAVFPGIRSYNVKIPISFRYMGGEIAGKISRSISDYNSLAGKERTKAMSEDRREKLLAPKRIEETRDYTKFVTELHKMYQAAITFPGVDKTEIDAELKAMKLPAFARKDVIDGIIEEIKFK